MMRIGLLIPERSHNICYSSINYRNQDIAVNGGHCTENIPFSAIGPAHTDVAAVADVKSIKYCNERHTRCAVDLGNKMLNSAAARIPKQCI